MANDGSAFEAEVQLSCRILGIYYHKLVVPLRVEPGGRTTKLHSNPYDSFLVHQGHYVALELKSQEEHGSFSLSQIRDEQWEGMQRAVDHEIPTWLLINMRQQRGEITLTRWSPKLKQEVTQTRTGILHQSQAWAFNFADWPQLSARLTYKNGKPRKSIPYELFSNKDLFIPLPRTHFPDPQTDKPVLIWDLRAVLPIICSWSHDH